MKREAFRWVRPISDPWVLGLATLFGAGYVKYGPGTVGSVVGIFWFLLIATIPSLWGYWIVLLLSLYIAAALCGEAATRIGKKDPGSVILDEFVAIPICFIGLEQQVFHQNGWILLLAGFALFRLFDITKPWLIGCLDRIEGGWGILLDDVGAALITCVCLHLLSWWIL